MPPAVLLVTPYHQQSRGNAVTAARLQKGLTSRSFEVDLLALDSTEGWSRARSRASARSYRLLHVLHAATAAPVLQHFPELAGLPLLLTATGTDLHLQWPGSLHADMINAFQRADRIVVFNPSFAALFTEIGCESKIVVIPQGVDLPGQMPWARSTLGLRDDQIVVLLPSGLRPIKRIEFAVQAVELARSSDSRLRLVIAGAPLDSDYSRRLFAQIKALPWVSYLSDVTHHQIGGLMAAADVVLNTSQMEGQPQAVLEAMSLGVPALLSAVPGNLGVITHGQEGFYADSPAAMSDYLLLMAGSQSLRTRLGQAAVRLTQERYTVEAEIAQYQALYRTLTGHPTASTSVSG